MDINGNLSENQRNEIYRKMLVPLKLKISQILLYDSENALEFLKEYNEILKNEEVVGREIIKQIVELEYKINNYESETGKEKMYEEQSNTFEQQINELEKSYRNMPLKEFETELEEIKNIYYTNSKNYNFKQKEKLELKINSMQASLIMKKSRNITIDDMQEMITEENKEGLTMYIYAELSKLVQEKSKEVQKIANQLKIKIANEEDFLYDTKTWRLLDSAQRNVVFEDEEQIETIVNLPAVQNKKTRLSFFDKIFGNKIKIGNKEMKVQKVILLGNEEVNVKDLSKIDMDWIARRISKEALQEIEIMRILKKNDKVPEEIYIQDARTPIYDFMSQDKEKNEDIQFLNEEGIKLNMGFIGEKFDRNVTIYTDEEVLYRYIGEMKEKNINNTIRLARFIDSMIGSNLKQQLSNEIGVFFEKCLTSKKEVYYEEELMKKLPIYSNLLKSYENLKQEYKETKVSFRAKEKDKRERFYKQNKFKENLLIEDKYKNEKKQEDKYRKNKKDKDKKNKNYNNNEEYEL